MLQQQPQWLVFTYHKTGTSLFAFVMQKIADRFGLRLANQYGLVRQIDPVADIVLLPHSLLAAPPARPYRAVRVIRDPRDIWVSGYFYHRRTREGWCRNTNFDPEPPIVYPRVSFAFQHYPERWKQAYLARLDGHSYQQNLLDRDRDSGLAFELANYTGCTLQAMRAWSLGSPDLLTVKFETITSGFDATMAAIFLHLGLSGDALTQARALAATEDIRRMDNAAIAAREQISGRTPTSWREVLSDQQIADFEREWGDVITALGYALATPAPSPTALRTARS